MNENIYEKIDSTLTTIERLNIPRKIVRDVLHATEFNAVVDKINEVKDYLNGPVKDVAESTTAYILDKINNVSLSLYGSNIPIEEGSSKSILNEITSIKQRITATEDRSVNNATNIASINSSLDDISYSLGIVTTKVNEMETDVDRKIETSYNSAIETANRYTDESYARLNDRVEDIDARVVHINDTTLTFDYDIRTEPLPATEKLIYDNDNDLYDGEYHD